MENFSKWCYNADGTNRERDAAGKGTPTLCHTTNEQAALELFISLPMEVQLEMVEMLKSLSSAQSQESVVLHFEPAAAFIGIDKDCLRESIDQGKCRFGIGGKNGLRGNRFARIPTLAFYNWVTMGANMKG